MKPNIFLKEEKVFFFQITCIILFPYRPTRKINIRCKHNFSTTFVQRSSHHRFSFGEEFCKLPFNHLVTKVPVWGYPHLLAGFLSTF